MTSRFHLFLLAAGALIVLVFWAGLHGDFLLDDYTNIVQNRAIHAERISADTLATAAGAYEPGAIGRPLATISFAVDHALWGGPVPFGFKLTNVLVHLLNALLVFAVVRSLLAKPALAGQQAGDVDARPFALLVALLWAIHPLQTGTVLYVVQRMEMLAVTSLLLGLLAYLKGRRLQMDGRPGAWAWIALSGALAASGLLSKETAVIFPLLTLSLELTILRFAGATPAQSRFWRWGYALGIVLATAAFFLVVLPIYAAPEAFAFRDFTLGERLLTQLRVLPMYLGQSLLPHPGAMLFNYDHLVASKGWLEPSTTLAGALLLGGLLAAAWWSRHRMPLVALGILWFFAGHFLTSNVVPLELAFEHRNYLPLLGVLLAVCALLQRFDQRRAVKALAVIAILAFAFISGIRSLTWGNPLILAAEHAAVNPLSARASNDLGIQYAEASGNDPASPLFARAIEEFRRGMALPGASPLPEHALILLMAHNGLPGEDAWWDSLEEKLRRRPIGPQEMLAMTALLRERKNGLVFDDARFQRAWAVLDGRGAVTPELGASYGNYLLLTARDDARALEALRKAGMASPTPLLREQILGFLVEQGRMDLAEALLEDFSAAR